MGGNINEGRMEELYTPEAREAFQKHFHQSLGKQLKKEPDTVELERRHDEGPPIFQVGEILELKGARFQVKRIDRKGLRLKILKG